jgi:cell pole-organizing protein PopZ
MPKRWTDLAPEKPAPTEAAAMERRAYERSPDDIKKAIENSRAAREDARALLGIPEPANSARPSDLPASQPSPAQEPEVDRHAEVPSVSRPSAIESAAPKPALLSERVERQVAASFSELSEAFAARSRKTFDEMAEEMIAPLLRDWMENNLPTLVERLVREEIERVARGAQ